MLCFCRYESVGEIAAAGQRLQSATDQPYGIYADECPSSGCGSIDVTGMPPHGLHARPESQMLKAAAQNAGMSAANMDALARSGIWENCRAAYEDIVKHLERLREERTDDRHQVICAGGVGDRGGSVLSERDSKPRDLSSHNCKLNKDIDTVALQN